MMKERDERGAIVRTPLAQVFAEPRVASAQISQLVAGCCIDLLEKRDDWYRIRGPDEYEGWVHQGYLSPVPDAGARHSPAMKFRTVTFFWSPGFCAMPFSE